MSAVAAVTPVTFTVIEHDPSALKANPVRETAPEPAVAVMVPLGQVVERPFGVETLSPAGKVSVKETLVSGCAADTVNVKLVVPPSGIVGAPKALLIVGGAGAAFAPVVTVPSSTKPVGSPHAGQFGIALLNTVATIVKLPSPLRLLALNCTELVQLL